MRTETITVERQISILSALTDLNMAARASKLLTNYCWIISKYGKNFRDYNLSTGEKNLPRSYSQYHRLDKAVHAARPPSIKARGANCTLQNGASALRSHLSHRETCR